MDQTQLQHGHEDLKGKTEDHMKKTDDSIADSRSNKIGYKFTKYSLQEAKRARRQT